MEEWERKIGRKYEYVVRARPDVMYQKKVYVPGVLRGEEKGWGREKVVWGQRYFHRWQMCDHFWIAPRGVAEVAFGAERSFRFCNKVKSGWEHCHGFKNDSKIMFLPRTWANETECLWSRHLMDHGVSYDNSHDFGYLVMTSKKQKSIGFRKCPWW